VIVLLSDIFKFDPNYLETEEKYKGIKADILGEDSSDDESGSEEGDGDDDDDEGTLGEFIPCFVV
jgi:pre-mRNA-splicing factor CWC22